VLASGAFIFWRHKQAIWLPSFVKPTTHGLPTDAHFFRPFGSGSGHAIDGYQPIPTSIAQQFFVGAKLYILWIETLAKVFTVYHQPLLPAIVQAKFNEMGDILAPEIFHFDGFSVTFFHDVMENMIKGVS
jgi:hypothetical protein